jgi:hypothetical protein
MFGDALLRHEMEAATIELANEPTKKNLRREDEFGRRAAPPYQWL